MDFQSIISFLGVSILLTLMPGSDNLCILTQSISKGKNTGMALVLGLCTGLLVHIMSAVLGLSAILLQSALAFSIIKYAGATYLLFLAYKAFREGKLNFEVHDEQMSNLNYKSTYKRGIIMNLLNPKISLFFLAFLPQFVDYSQGTAAKQMFIYGMIFLVQTLLIFSLMNIFAGKLGSYLRNNRVIANKIGFIQGILFSVIGIKIALSEK